MSGLSLARKVLGLAGAALPLLALLSGCSEQYPADLTYPVRKDLLVIKTAQEKPFYPAAPGHMEDAIAKIKDNGGETYDPNKLSAADRRELGQALQTYFGTPAEPKINIEDLKGMDDWSEANKALTDLRLGEKDLAAGSVLYRRHCVHCHGLTGDGRGPTGPWLAPSPRDYRRGMFKFTSIDTDKAGIPKARRADLRRTLRRGIEGTTMQSFSVLADEEIEQLISYVIHLSVRGETEFNTLVKFFENKGDKATLTGESFDGEVRNKLLPILGDWAKSDKALLEPGRYPYKDDEKDGDETQLTKSIRRGFEQFVNMTGAGSCIDCHVDFGRQVPFRYDDWGTLVRPADLTAGVYRGGRRPIDLYWRVRTGIVPSGMSAASFKPTDNIDPFWDVVNFVRALPYPPMLPPDVRKKIYDQKDSAKESERASR